MLSRCEHLGLSPGVTIIISCLCPMLVGEEAVVCHIVIVQLTQNCTELLLMHAVLVASLMVLPYAWVCVVCRQSVLHD